MGDHEGESRAEKLKKLKTMGGKWLTGERSRFI
jgi:hypothetical protein